MRCGGGRRPDPGRGRCAVGGGETRRRGYHDDRHPGRSSSGGGAQWADQPYRASRVAALGIGVAHDVQAPTTESLSAALSAALTPEIRARAAAVAGTIRTDGASMAAKRLLGAVSRDRQPVPAELMP